MNLEESPQKPPKVGGFTYAAWYRQNQKRLSIKRANRYRQDATYRTKALERSRHQRAHKSVPEDGYTISFQDMATQLGITIWVLREWRKKDYFPEPKRRYARLWFNAHQAVLLRQLRVFFDLNGTRVLETKKQALGDLIALIYSNW